MKLKELTQYLDSEIPLSFQEEYDNSGLQVGDPEKEIKSALLTLDVTEAVIDEAVENGDDFIISHHPVIFSGIKKLSGKTFTERIIFKAIKNEVSIYSAHTNLDVFGCGVSRKMAEKLNLQNIEVLAPLKGRLLKLVTYIPESHLNVVREAIFNAGAGVIGNYDSCGYVSQGTGSFRGGDQANPFVGEKGKLHFENEIRFETVLLSHLKETVIKALLDSHPYEEVAYDIYSLENKNVDFGLGCTGELSTELTGEEFLKLISGVFDSRGVRFSKPTGRNLKKIALCGGAGISLLQAAISSGADAFVTADVKYHNYFDAENRILLVDTGHYESEKFSTEILYDLIIKKFPKFAVRFSKTNTNPINYL
jgi:dinuclear metal center YbgI/SA1388 family protein